jgi:hypothetical protein
MSSLSPRERRREMLKSVDIYLKDWDDGQLPEVKMREESRLVYKTA